MSDLEKPTHHENAFVASVNPPAVLNADRGHGICRLRILVPRSNVVAERAPAELNGDQRVIVRCRECDRRAFDVVGVPADVFLDDPARLGTLRIVRACRCGRHQHGQVTGRPGFAPTDGLAGRWCCECGSFLAKVDAIRGRVAVPCRRCHRQLRATAADVMVAVQGEDLLRAS